MSIRNKEGIMRDKGDMELDKNKLFVPIAVCFSSLFGIIYETMWRHKSFSIPNVIGNVINVINKIVDC